MIVSLSRVPVALAGHAPRDCTQLAVPVGKLLRSRQRAAQRQTIAVAVRDGPMGSAMSLGPFRTAITDPSLGRDSRPAANSASTCSSIPAACAAARSSVRSCACSAATASAVAASEVRS